ncbi:thioredoxin domain-containing protein [Planomonospora sp. ID82291]|uniref:DsbA family protein n=1 Tax=Planomonospora sp. ID82291 TaxID=2738136 RepID=UPI0018C40F6B|nr:thioredoxin domain-containing protein [Planomonospora sp. ID82291]MBG0817444.1 thioredoxin domain-containing protein [Planomonospora sp. ID82291]
MGKAARDQSARDRIKAQREAERKQEQRKRMVTITTVAVVALAAVGAGWWYSAQRGKSEEATTALAPITVQGDGSVVMAKAGVEKPVLDIYEDFQCPFCKQLDESNGPTIKNMAAAGQVKVVYHPITIFPESVTRSNSVRAGAAARCVPDGKQWMAYHDKLFEEQPSETVEGFKTGELVEWGKEAGVTAPNFEQCVTSQQHAKAHTDYAAAQIESAKIEGTPTLKLNGTVLGDEGFSPSGLRQAILDAAK